MNNFDLSKVIIISGILFGLSPCVAFADEGGASMTTPPSATAAEKSGVPGAGAEPGQNMSPEQQKREEDRKKREEERRKREEARKEKERKEREERRKEWQEHKQQEGQGQPAKPATPPAAAPAAPASQSGT